MSNHENYLRLRIHAAPDTTEVRAQISEALSELDLEPDESNTPSSPTGDFTGYFGDQDAVLALAKALTGLPGLAFELWTEEEQGEPGLIVTHASGVGTFTGGCDRGGEVVVPETVVRRIALEEDPAERTRLLEEVTGCAVRAALHPGAEQQG
ncbi:DUF3145 family protein [Kitasatospora sp. NPDC059146]|uniref:DUF3145 family protein n=1 Tax=unclassified Kitasatospora TaxID=2633591 RepID=UPI0036B898B2